MATSQRDSDLTAPRALHGPPAGYFVLVSQQNAEDSLGVARILASLAGCWKLLLVAALLGAIAAGAFSFTMPKTYRARMVLAPVTSEEGMGSAGGLSSELGGIAAMAGVDVTGDAARREQSFPQSAWLCAAAVALHPERAEATDPSLWGNRRTAA